MRIELTTDGGFTGRGIGSVSVESNDVPAVAEALANARPATWRDDYRGHGADLVTYTLAFGETTVSFNDAARIPADLHALFEAVWACR